jgi:hypothetical protein
VWQSFFCCDQEHFYISGFSFLDWQTMSNILHKRLNVRSLICQIFHCTMYQNMKNVPNSPNGHKIGILNNQKIYKMAITYN